MNRRSVLKTVTILVGGAMSAGTVATVLNSCQPTENSGISSTILSDAQARTLEELVEVIIPATDTPGAKELKVHEAFAQALAEIIGADDQKRIVKGLDQINEYSKDQFGKAFADAEADQKVATVKHFDDAAYADNASNDAQSFKKIKALTVTCYFTTEVGQTQVLQHMAVPGPYQGCIPLAEAGNGKTWAQ